LGRYGTWTPEMASAIGISNSVSRQLMLLINAPPIQIAPHFLKGLPPTLGELDRKFTNHLWVSRSIVLVEFSDESTTVGTPVA
jgi:hypothetical protein